MFNEQNNVRTMPGLSAPAKQLGSDRQICRIIGYARAGRLSLVRLKPAKAILAKVALLPVPSRSGQRDQPIDLAQCFTDD